MSYYINIQFQNDRGKTPWEKKSITLNSKSIIIEASGKSPEVIIYFNDIEIIEGESNDNKTINEIEMDSLKNHSSPLSTLNNVLKLKTINQNTYWLFQLETNDIFQYWVSAINNYKFSSTQQSLYIQPSLIITPRDEQINNNNLNLDYSNSNNNINNINCDNNNSENNKIKKKSRFSHKCKFRTSLVSLIIYCIIWAVIFVLLWFITAKDTAERDPVLTTCKLENKKEVFLRWDSDNYPVYDVTYTLTYQVNSTEITSTYTQVEERCLPNDALKPTCILRTIPTGSNINCYYDANRPKNVWFNTLYTTYRDFKMIFTIIGVLLIPLLIFLYYTYKHYRLMNGKTF